MAAVPFDQLDGFIWMNGKLIRRRRQRRMFSRMACTMAPRCLRASAPMAARYSSRASIRSGFTESARISRF